MAEHTCPSVQNFLDRYVLQYMAESGPSGCGEWAFGLSSFTNEWITKDMARAICRSLTDRGFAIYLRGLLTEDGEVAGSGYGITDEGRAHLKGLLAETATLRQRDEQLAGKLAVYAITEEYDWPGDTPEFCGWLCNVCGDHVEPDGSGHRVDCLITGERPKGLRADRARADSSALADEGRGE